MKHILSLSYGKDSLACIEAINQLRLPLDEIVHVELMATDDIPAELPEMIDFKNKADEIIYEKYGFRVKKIKNPITYEQIFYRKRRKGKNEGKIYGFPCIFKSWCVDKFKTSCLDFGNNITYLGIATDEQKRIERHSKKTNVILPLHKIGWTEQDCVDWCKANNLLSPIYNHSARGGCWFCHKQRVGELRYLRQCYPDLWDKLLEWDKDSPYKFKINHTVQDYEHRFYLEDEVIDVDKNFKWENLKKIDKRKSDN